MVDPAYHRALVDAGIVAPGNLGSGITPWRGVGLQVVRRMVETFLDKVTGFAAPVEAEHSFLDPQESYDRVFPTYANVYRLENTDRARAGWVLRADNMHLNVAWLRRTGHPGPVVVTSGLLRQLRGSGAPLFRERYIWPAIQLTHLLDRGEGPAALEGYRQVLEATFAAFGLPVLTVAVEELTPYGEVCHLTVSCLRDGRPTVLATTYLMARQYREALGVSGELVDVGFTGKALALAAMHHRDRWGLGLPSVLAPVQVGVLASKSTPAPALERWVDQSTGVRAQVVRVPSGTPRRRHRVERAILRGGAPFALGAGEDGGWRISRRNPIVREETGAFPGRPSVRAELDAYDERLLRSARGRFEQGIQRIGSVRGVCDRCAKERRLPLFGRIVPTRPARCAACGGTGVEAMLSDRDRFY